MHWTGETRSVRKRFNLGNFMHWTRETLSVRKRSNLGNFLHWTRLVAFMNSLSVISVAHVDPQPGFQPECGIPPCPWGGGGVINGLQEG